MIDNKIVGNNFVKLRNNFGLSQNEFADRCGLSRNDVPRIEEGEKSVELEMIPKIANSLEFDPCDLLLFITEGCPTFQQSFSRLK